MRSPEWFFHHENWGKTPIENRIAVYMAAWITHWQDLFQIRLKKTWMIV